MKCNKRLIATISEIIIGIILIICACAGLLDSYWSGMGTGLVVVGSLMMIRQIRYRTNTVYRENVDLEVNDERNKFLRMKAWSWAGFLFVVIGAFGSIILKIVGLDLYVMIAASSVCIIMVLYWICYLVLSRKY